MPRACHIIRVKIVVASCGACYRNTKAFDKEYRDMRQLYTRLPFAVATFLLGVAVTGLISPGTNRSSSNYSLDSYGPAAREVMRAEAEYVRANNMRDAEALDLVLAEDLRAGGRMRTKTQRMAFILSPALEDVRFETEGVRVYAAETEAFVSGRARFIGRYAGRAFGGWEYNYTRRYEKRGDRWQIVSISFSYGR